ncbi:type 2 DNA topoisomerase 6 subunit B-like isoform X2 [Tripterygium wilfordii]|uniref:type 2 DNA topoisomerase 6 subunit B-like isoform X2 n=1 Tax=Tripterygium wilfordii TaxID=458696 RepID=UPI0018F7F935|nr:type 2 DNA topoisomerase 6 subunit B-like isoform X2 [Tripterygium wilfordii]
MQISSLQQLCLHLISCAFQRCRLSEDLCRLSVVLKPSPASDPPVVGISISDTGIGSCLEEIRDLRWEGVENWGICDTEIYNYHLHIREKNLNKRLTILPSNPKSGAKFSGSEVYLSISESINALLGEFKNFFEKILILKIPNVACELVVEHGDTPGSRYENVFLANELNPLPFSTSNVVRLKSGLLDYVMKHKCRLNESEHLKVGSGMASCTGRRSNSGLIMEAVVVIGEQSEFTSLCSSTGGAKTEVLYFEEFSPSSITQSFCNAFNGIDWKSYGLTLDSAVNQGGQGQLEWDNLPSLFHIDIALHCYHEQAVIPPVWKKIQNNKSLIKKAVKLALDDLKENHAGVLSSRHALKIRSYAPDLARTISGLISSSNDPDFQAECLSLLGLQYQEIGGVTVENCIKEKICSVIDMNDGKPQRSKDSAPFLFEDDCLEEVDFQDYEYEED